jgi:tetratricopeptide (TPR) repeat protein
LRQSNWRRRFRQVRNRKWNFGVSRTTSPSNAKVGKFGQAIPELDRHVKRHPDDPVGHYELAQAERSVDMAQAMEHLDKAVAPDPNYLQARAARVGLYYQEGKPESALPHLEFAAAKQPDNAATLDRLGQTYQALDRAADAVRFCAGPPDWRTATPPRSFIWLARWQMPGRPRNPRRRWIVSGSWVRRRKKWSPPALSLT